MGELENVVRPGVSRGLDFVVIEELRKRTGVSPVEGPSDSPECPT
jgi:hypothetical protein